MLSLWEFKEQQQIHLDLECVSALYARIAHLKDDEVQIDQPILKLIGFKHKFTESSNKKEEVI